MVLDHPVCLREIIESRCKRWRTTQLRLLARSKIISSRVLQKVPIFAELSKEENSKREIHLLHLPDHASGGKTTT